MGCCGKSAGLDADQKKVLEALKGMDKPASGKDVSEATGLDSRVSGVRSSKGVL